MMPHNRPLEQLLRSHVRTAAPELTETLEDGRARCLACAHRCLLAPGRSGICKVRFQDGSGLQAPWGYVAGLALDPIEKKPFYHVLPGEEALSFGMLGCDLHCPYCQNWITSQTLRDPASTGPVRQIDPAAVVSLAEQAGSRVLVSTYNEPLITAEWSRAIFEKARERGMHCGYVSNGHATPEVLRWLRPVTDLYKIDLKSFDDRRYRELGGVLARVLESIEEVKRLGYWLEVVTLVVPGFNDSDEELGAIAGFLASVDRDIPWHVTAFHPDYRMDTLPSTPASTLARAWEIGRQQGLHYVYAGNLRTGDEERERTRCPSCQATLITRRGFLVREQRLREGCCPECGATVAGVWSGA